jgi:DNA-binding transcriptional regulator YiaG
MRSTGKSGKRRLGERLVAEFSELRDVLRAKIPVQSRYTVRTVELDLKPRNYDAKAVRRVRLSLGVSQAIFAELLDVSSDLVSSWEQGIRTPSGPACRLMDLMETDKSRWIKILEQGANRKISRCA